MACNVMLANEIDHYVRTLDGGADTVLVARVEGDDADLAIVAHHLAVAHLHLTPMVWQHHRRADLS
jgi:hypothetical protein